MFADRRQEMSDTLIEVRISDAMAVATMIERWDEIAKDNPKYALSGSRRSGRWSTIYAGTAQAWRAWAAHCRDNAEGALDYRPDMRLNAKAAERIEAALALRANGEPA
jgi:hypothetical protein